MPEDKKKNSVHSKKSEREYENGGGIYVLPENEVVFSLLERVREGDADAFRVLCEQYRPMTDALVFRFFSGFCKEQPEERNELEQEACIALYRAALSYRQDRHTTFGLYARFCVRNRLISYLRKRNARLSEEVFIDSTAYGFSSEGSDPGEQIAAKEAFQHLMERFTQQLSPKELEVFRMYAAGVSYRDIAEKLRISEKSVDNTVYRIRRKLKSCLE